jgi:hypothetical protein
MVALHRMQAHRTADLRMRGKILAWMRGKILAWMRGKILAPTPAGAPPQSRSARRLDVLGTL